MIRAVVLAAGASSRMGAHKLLLPLAGEPLVRRTVRQVVEAGLVDVLVVLGRDADDVRSALAGLACRTTTNPDYGEGLGTSFRAAMAAIGDCDAALVVLADQPLVSPASYRRLVDAFSIPRPGGPPLVVSARFAGVVAPPQLFARPLFPELTRLQEGARPVLARHADATVVVELPPAELLDVDTPDDYTRATGLVDRGPERRT